MGFNEVPVYLVLLGFVAYLTVLFFGIPAYLRYRSLRWTNPLIFLLGGGVIGFIVPLILIPTSDIAAPFPFTLEERAWFIFSGALSALLFRLLLPNDWLSTSLTKELP